MMAIETMLSAGYLFSDREFFSYVGTGTIPTRDNNPRCLVLGSTGVTLPLRAFCATKLNPHLEARTLTRSTLAATRGKSASSATAVRWRSGLFANVGPGAHGFGRSFLDFGLPLCATFTGERYLLLESPSREAHDLIRALTRPN